MRRQYSGFFYFVSTCILPGLGYMYLGLIKRGLFFLASFFCLAYLAGAWGMTFAGIAIPIMWITLFFDGWNKLRLLRAGEYVEDDIRDVKNFCHKYKTILILAVGIGLILWFLGTGINYLIPSTFALQSIVKKLAPIALIAIGLYVMIQNRKKRNAHQQ